MPIELGATRGVCGRCRKLSAHPEFRPLSLAAGEGAELLLKAFDHDAASETGRRGQQGGRLAF